MVCSTFPDSHSVSYFVVLLFRKELFTKLDLLLHPAMREYRRVDDTRAFSLPQLHIPSRLKLDGRKRSKTTLSDNNQNGHAPIAQHEQLSVQTSLGDGTASRPRSLTGDSNDQFILIDTISIDESVSIYSFLKPCC